MLRKKKRDIYNESITISMYVCNGGNDIPIKNFIFSKQYKLNKN